MGLGRAAYILLVPQVFTLAALVLSIVTFFSGYQHATGLKTIHFMTIDLSGLNAGVQEISSSLSALNVSSVYTVGANGWCYGKSTSSLSGCTTPSEPFYFDISEILGIVGLSSLESQLPSEIQKYNSLSKDVSLGIWGAFLAVIILSFLQILAGFTAMCSRAGACCASLFANLSLLASIIGAGLATGMYYEYTSKINKYAGTLGIKATLDTSGMGFAWATVAAILLADVLFLFATCCAARRTRYVAVPEKESQFM